MRTLSHTALGLPLVMHFWRPIWSLASRAQPPWSLPQSPTTRFVQHLQMTLSLQTDLSKDIKVEAPGDAPTGSDDTTSPYYNICSPCIRHNDYCKDVSTQVPNNKTHTYANRVTVVCLAGQGVRRLLQLEDLLRQPHHWRLPSAHGLLWSFLQMALPLSRLCDTLYLHTTTIIDGSAQNVFLGGRCERVTCSTAGVHGDF